MSHNHDDAETALTVLSEPGLSVTRSPDAVLAEAAAAAKALKAVIDKKPKKVMFGGEQYLEYEDWQTVGRFYGIAPRIINSRFVEYGTASGWEAIAEAVHVPSGRQVSTGEGMCLNDEEKWSARPKYALVYVKKSGGTSVEDPGKDELIWEKGSDGKTRPKKERRVVGEERVPLFQLRSMAQTRAAAKALRNALAWVVVLAGYRPTPAEEMDAVVLHDTTPRERETVEPAEGSEEPAPPPEPEAPQIEDTADARAVLLNKIVRLRKKKGISDDVFTGICAKYKVEVSPLAEIDNALAPVPTTPAPALIDILNRVAAWRAN